MRNAVFEADIAGAVKERNYMVCKTLVPCSVNVKFNLMFSFDIKKKRKKIVLFN